MSTKKHKILVDTTISHYLDLEIIQRIKTFRFGELSLKIGFSQLLFKSYCRKFFKSVKDFHLSYLSAGFV